MAPVLTSEEAVDALQSGLLVILPTDTVYGIACLPEPLPVEALFEAKRRPADKNIQLLVPDRSWLKRVGLPSADAVALAETFWPGPLTLVVAASEQAPAVLASDGTIGLRMPAHPVTLEVLRQTGPLAASSANLSGEPTPVDAGAIAVVFAASVAGYLDGGPIAGSGSTVLDMTGAAPVFLREGPITPADVTRALS